MEDHRDSNPDSMEIHHQPSTLSLIKTTMEDDEILSHLQLDQPMYPDPEIGPLHEKLVGSMIKLKIHDTPIFIERTQLRRDIELGDESYTEMQMHPWQWDSSDFPWDYKHYKNRKWGFKGFNNPKLHSSLPIDDTIFTTDYGNLDDSQVNQELEASSLSCTNWNAILGRILEENQDKFAPSTNLTPIPPSSELRQYAKDNGLNQPPLSTKQMEDWITSLDKEFEDMQHETRKSWQLEMDPLYKQNTSTIEMMEEQNQEKDRQDQLGVKLDQGLGVTYTHRPPVLN